MGRYIKAVSDIVKLLGRRYSEGVGRSERYRRRRWNFNILEKLKPPYGIYGDKALRLIEI